MVLLFHRKKIRRITIETQVMIDLGQRQFTRVLRGYAACKNLYAGKRRRKIRSMFLLHSNNLVNRKPDKQHHSCRMGSCNNMLKRLQAVQPLRKITLKWLHTACYARHISDISWSPHCGRLLGNDNDYREWTRSGFRFVVNSITDTNPQAGRRCC